jgi:hypothetical protein
MGRGCKKGKENKKKENKKGKKNKTGKGGVPVGGFSASTLLTYGFVRLPRQEPVDGSGEAPRQEPVDGSGEAHTSSSKRAAEKQLELKQGGKRQSVEPPADVEHSAGFSEQDEYEDEDKDVEWIDPDCEEPSEDDKFARQLSKEINVPVKGKAKASSAGAAVSSSSSSSSSAHAQAAQAGTSPKLVNIKKMDGVVRYVISRTQHPLDTATEVLFRELIARIKELIGDTSDGLERFDLFLLDEMAQFPDHEKPYGALAQFAGFLYAAVPEVRLQRWADALPLLFRVDVFEEFAKRGYWPLGAQEVAARHVKELDSDGLLVGAAAGAGSREQHVPPRGHHGGPRGARWRGRQGRAQHLRLRAVGRARRLGGLPKRALAGGICQRHALHHAAQREAGRAARLHHVRWRRW